MSDPIRVVVADDQTTIREALAMMLDLDADIEVVGAGADGEQAVALVQQHAPDVLVTDLRMPVLDGAQATSRALAVQPELAVLLLTTFDDEESILTALSAGARGYLTKDAGRVEIVRAIRAVAGGQSVLDPQVQQRLVARATRAGADSPAGSSEDGTAGTVAADLTPREVEVLTLIAEGLTNREIARRLFLSEATVKTHINNLFAKTGVRDRAQAMRLAYQEGLTTPPS